MPTLFSDTFTAADTTAMGANYTESSGDTQIVSNRARLAANNPGVLRTTTTAHAAIADVKVSITLVTGVAASDGGPCARVVNGAAPASANFYSAEAWTSGTGRVELYRYDSGAGTAVLLETGIAVTIVPNAIVALEVSGTGATVTLKSYYNGVLLTTFGDTNANRIVTATQTGFHNWSPSGVNSDYDNFLVESLSAAAGNLAWVKG